MNEADSLVIDDSSSVNVTEKDVARFWAKVDKNGPLPDQTNPHYAGLGPCWVWTASLTSKGYGQFSFRGKPRAAHRIAVIIADGCIGTKLDTLHLCDNPLCVRRDHLTMGARTENVQDMMRKGRARRPIGDESGYRKHPECFPRGEQCQIARLTSDDVRAIRLRYSHGGTSFQLLADEWGVAKGTVRALVNRRSWKHIA